MKDIYKSMKLYTGYIKHLINNPHTNFNDYIKHLLNNKEITDTELNEKTTFRIVNIEFSKENKGVLIHPTSNLIKPEGMSNEDALKVISFIYSNYIYDKKYRLINNLEILLTCKFGFTSINTSNNENTIDLFLTNNLLNFIYSKYFDKYFNWYKRKVSIDEIITIYEKVNPEITLTLTHKYSYKPHN